MVASTQPKLLRATSHEHTKMHSWPHLRALPAVRVTAKPDSLNCECVCVLQTTFEVPSFCANLGRATGDDSNTQTSGRPSLSGQHDNGTGREGERLRICKYLLLFLRASRVRPTLSSAELFSDKKLHGCTSEARLRTDPPRRPERPRPEIEFAHFQAGSKLMPVIGVAHSARALARVRKREKFEGRGGANATKIDRNLASERRLTSKTNKLARRRARSDRNKRPRRAIASRRPCELTGSGIATNCIFLRVIDDDD